MHLFQIKQVAEEQNIVWATKTADRYSKETSLEDILLELYFDGNIQYFAFKNPFFNW